MNGASEIAIAVPELGSEFRLVEVLDPTGAFPGSVAVVLFRRRGQSAIAARRMSQPRQSPCLHRVEMCAQDRRAHAGSAKSGGTGHVGSFLEVAQESRLVAHRVEDAGGQEPSSAAPASPSAWMKY